MLYEVITGTGMAHNCGLVSWILRSARRLSFKRLFELSTAIHHDGTKARYSLQQRSQVFPLKQNRITSYNVCYTKLLRSRQALLAPGVNPTYCKVAMAIAGSQGLTFDWLPLRATCLLSYCTNRRTFLIVCRCRDTFFLPLAD